MKELLKAIKKPHKAIKLIYELISGGRQLCLPLDDLFKYLTEFYLNKEFFNKINAALQKAKRDFPDPRLGGAMIGYPASLLYALVRIVKPSLIIETGVGPGGSSSIILLALHANKKGRLISIDLPGADAQIYPKIGKLFNIYVPPGYEVGWLVPPWMRDRWDLRLGDSKELLPRVLDEVDVVDMFLHDSLHTDEHVSFELSTVFPHLLHGGLLMADDVNEYWSLAFVRLCEAKRLPYYVFNHRLGVAKKCLQEE